MRELEKKKEKEVLTNYKIMRRILGVLLISLVVLSCQKYEQDMLSCLANTELFGKIESMDATRTSMDENNNVLWSEEDQIIAFMKTTLGVKYQIKEQYVGTTTGGFSKINESSGDDLESGQEIDHNVVLYPHSTDVWCMKNDNSSPTKSYKLNVVLPQTQYYSANSFANGAFQMVAVSSSNQLTFRNICGGVKLQFKGVDKIKSIKLEGIGGELISGKSTVVGYVNGEAPSITMHSTKATKTVELDCGEGVQLNESSPTTFILAVPPVTFASGMKITVTDTDGMSRTLTNTASNTIKRSSLLTFPVITYKQDGVFELQEGAMTSYEISAEGATIEIPVVTNQEYKVVVSEDAKWISVVETKALRKEVVVLGVAENKSNSERLSEVILSTLDGVELQKVSISQEARSFQPDNEIWYTSTDGEIVVPYSKKVFGANLISNIYENGQGVITFDGAVTSIGKSAFMHCSGLKSIILPRGVSYISNNAFDNCKSLEYIEIPESVTSIGQYAFSGCKLQSISLPVGLKSIGQCVFQGCRSLTDIVLPDKITQIPNSMFSNCAALSKIVLPDDITSIGDYAFSGCNLASINIPEKVTTIGIGAFKGCKLINLTLPASVTSIGYSAFEGSSGKLLINCDIPGGQSSDTRPFYNTNFTEIVIGDMVKSIGRLAFLGSKSVTSLTIGKNVVSIGYDAFLGCNITRLNIPDSVTSIGEYAFSGCNLLEELTIGSGLATIPAYAFYGCGIKNLSIPDNVTTIGECAFYNCKNMTSVTIPNGVTTIGRVAFEGCSNLTTVFIPSSLTTIEERVFCGCSNLSSVTIPNSVTSIVSSAFQGCTSLTSVTIPESVENIGCYAFGGCSSLIRVDIKAISPPELNCNPVQDTNDDLKIYVPAGSLEEYKSASIWKYLNILSDSQ
ncbi:MAG: leucine-rich repeat protein [Bacteroidales bacterium]|nr:leucine-rich repeat protein [Bacteroidales bacterium]